MASLLAILSKHLIRSQNKHVFNPAAFGIFLSMILCGASTQWMGTYIWYIVVPFGAYLAYKTRRIEIVAGYALAFLVLFGGSAVVQKASLWNVLGYSSYFYIFIMLIEPKTAPIKTAGKYLFGAGAAAFAFVVTQAGLRVDAEIFSLLAMNAAVPLLNKIVLKKGA
jgi:Na+-translocating ferredoxin:NAD+ oxidoreductase RnfD subunit